MKQTYETGLRGEETAEEYLTGKGMACLERRYRSRCGEIDLIMQDGETIVFVEVKTRRNGAPGSGMMSVNAAKQRRVTNAAMLYLMNSRLLGRPVRFDVVEINSDRLIHVRDAFQPGGMFYR